MAGPGSAPPRRAPGLEPFRICCGNKGLTPGGGNSSLGQTYFMAENIPNIPSGAVPPKKETGKVQPKKETVRINLPPKPSAAPTIKLPTLPPGGPTGGPAPTAPIAAPSAAAPAHPPSAPRATAAAPTSMRSAPAAPRPASAPIAARPAVSTLDTVLAIAAAVVGLAAVGSTLYLWLFLPNL